MIDIKAKTRIHRYSCYYCDCTGFFERKRTVFQIWSWGYQIVDKKICNYCNGRGFIEFKVDKGTLGKITLFNGESINGTTLYTDNKKVVHGSFFSKEPMAYGTLKEYTNVA